MSIVEHEMGAGYVTCVTKSTQYGEQLFIRNVSPDLKGGAAIQEFSIAGAKVSSSSKIDITKLEDGNYVVAWDAGASGSGAGISVQIVSAAFEPVGSVISIQTNLSSAGHSPSVSKLQGGGFALSWTSISETGQPHIFSQVHNSHGDALGSPHEINVDAFNTNVSLQPVSGNSSLLALKDGGYIVAWTQANSSSNGIYALQYDAYGTPSLNGVIRVADTGSSYTSAPKLNMTANGDVVVGWDLLSSTVVANNHTFNSAIIQTDLYKASASVNSGEPDLSGSPMSSYIPSVFRPDIGSGNAENIYKVLDGGNIILATSSTSGVKVSLLSPDFSVIKQTTIASTANSMEFVSSLDGSVTLVLNANEPNFNVVFDSGGNKFAVQHGDSGANTISWANAGNVAIYGHDGNDTLSGGSGGDILNGGVGADKMVGGLGNDVYYMDNAGDVAVEQAGQGSDTVVSSVSIALGANIENLMLSGGGRTATGNNLSNRITGNDQGNTINGLAGADTMVGGLGNDIYIVDNINDRVVESNASIAEVDTVLSSVSFSLAENVERLTLTGAGNINATGNASNNLFVGNSGDNIFRGGAGVDTVSYTSSTTKVNVSLGAVLNSGAGVDTLINIENLIGSVFNDTLAGDKNSNTLNGGAGADVMAGGDGNDSYVVDNVGDAVVEVNSTSSQVDTVFATVSYALSSNVENLTLRGSGNINATGNGLNNTFIGNSGNNQFDGVSGVDTVDYSSSVASITAYLSDNYVSGDGVDRLTNIDNIVGSKYADIIHGDRYNNKLNGGSGADYMAGGDGNDVYVVDSIGDKVVETNAAASQVDTVLSAINFTLSGNIENLTLTGSGNINAYGNSLNNILSGNSGNNTFNGGAGQDTVSYANSTGSISASIDSELGGQSGGHGNDKFISIENITGSKYNDSISFGAGNNIVDGGAGNDILSGGSGNDVLIGGGGKDKLTGGSGSDRFDFNSLSEMTTGLGRDVITDFVHGIDKINLSSIDSNSLSVSNDAFVFLGGGGFNENSPGQLRFDNGILYGNTDLDASAEFEIELIGVTSIAAADFIM